MSETPRHASFFSKPGQDFSFRKLRWKRPSQREFSVKSPSIKITATLYGANFKDE